MILVRAKFRGKCPCCGEWINEGDSISRLADDYDGHEWVCESCAEES